MSHEQTAGLSLKVIARIHSEFPAKFGVPRQSGLVPGLRAKIVFEPEYRRPQALRGLEGFSHIWLLWGFSHTQREGWSPTVRPPRLGGNTRLGVFATRSPYRPNPIGLSCVGLEGLELHSPEGPLLYVKGADMVDGTPIYDIKPYLPFTDSRPEASGGFAADRLDYSLKINISPELLAAIEEPHREALLELLAQDPRPAYQQDPERIYGLDFAGLAVRFSVDGDILTVLSIEK